MTDQIFAKQDFVLGDSGAASAASACLSDARMAQAITRSVAETIAAKCVEAKPGTADQIAKVNENKEIALHSKLEVFTSKVGDPLYSLNRLENLIAQNTIRAIEKGDVQGVRGMLQTLAENPKMQDSVMTGLTNHMEAFFPRTHVTWESGKNKDGTPFVHLQLQRAHDFSKSSSYTSLEIGSDGTEIACYTPRGHISKGKTINATDALRTISTLQYEKKDLYLPNLKVF